MTHSKTVSIIIPSFNREEFISETLESVIAQTSPNWECVIVDDGSTDNSVKIIKDFVKRDSRFKLYHRDREPKGACTCRNIGVDKCTGEYLIFLDTDDILAPFCVEQRLNVMTEDLDFAIFPALYFRDEPFDLNIWWNIDKPGISELDRQFNHDAICQGTGPLFKKESFVRMGKWNEELLIWQDIELFFIAYINDYKYAKFFNLPPDLHIRRYEASISRGGYHQLPKIISRAAVIKNVHKNLIVTNKKHLTKRLVKLSFEVAEAFYRSKNYKEGDEFIKWSLTAGIFNNKERLKLKIIKHIMQLRLSRFTQPVLKTINKYYKYETTHGQIPYTKEPLT